MNTPKNSTFLRRLLGPLLGLAAGVLHAQSFDTGSDGSLGHLHITNSLVLDLPADGRLKVRSLVVESGSFLYFRPNAANTPVYILSQGDVRIAGQINVAGESVDRNQISGGLGGPGGFRGGNRASDGMDAGAGQGPGGGSRQRGTATSEFPGAAGHRISPSNDHNPQNGQVYGTPTLIPMIGGSGGGGGWSEPGGGGGGAVLVASSTRITLVGSIDARGGNAPQYNGGSGGAVRLVAPIVEGTGHIHVQGNAAGSEGRIRIDTFDARIPGLQTGGFVPSTGSLLFTGLDLPGAPRLEVTQVGRFEVAPGEGNAFSILLPVGSSPQQNVVVRATGFGRRIPIQVVLTPDSGDRQVFNATLDNSNPGSIEVAVPVVFPANVTTLVNAWTVPGQ